MSQNHHESSTDQSIAQQQAEDATQAANDGQTSIVDPDSDVPGNTADTDGPDASGDSMYGVGQPDQS